MKNPMNIDPRATDLLGYVMTWDVGSGKHDVVRIRESLLKAGLDESMVPNLNLKNAFVRALRALSKDSLIDTVAKDEHCIRFQLTDKHVEGRDYIEFTRKAIVTLELDSGNVHCADNNVECSAKALLQSAMDLRTGPDISRYIKRMMESYGDMFPLNPSKGVTYFVPIHHFDLLSKVEKFVQDLGGSLPLWPVPMGTERGNASVKVAVENGLETMAKDLEVALETWDATTQEYTKKRMWEKVEKLEFKMRSYSGYLQDRSSVAMDTLKDLRKKVQMKIEETEAETV